MCLQQNPAILPQQVLNIPTELKKDLNMKMKEVLREQMNKLLKESEKYKQLKERNKTVQDIKMVIETIKKTWTEGILEVKS